MQYVLGIDLGTSYFKFGLFDREGRMAGFSRIISPKRGTAERCELPIDEFWATLHTGVGRAIAQADAHEIEVAAVGYSSQANSFLLMGAGDRPLTPLILWPDRRNPGIPAAIEALWNRDEFLPTTGIGIALSDQMAVVKLASLAELPEWQRTRRVMTISDYLTFSLTGQAVGDAGTAVLLGLLDPAALAWWPPALRAARLRNEMLSRPLRPGSLAGPLTEQGARGIGLAPGTPFCVGTLDHHAAALGAGAGSLARVSISMGTVLACLRPCVGFHPALGAITGPGFVPGEFFQLAFCNEGAGMLEVYRDAYAPGENIADLLSRAASAPAGCGCLRVLLDSAAGQVRFEGGPKKPSAGLQARAVLEAVADRARSLLESFCGPETPQHMVITGGAARSAFWVQLLAERLGCQVWTTGCQEPACRGAAMLAARSAGWFDSLSQAAAQWITSEHRFHPALND